MELSSISAIYDIVAPLEVLNLRVSFHVIRHMVEAMATSLTLPFDS